MNIKTLFASALVLSMSSLFTGVSFAAAHEEKAENMEEAECITEEALAEMTEEQKAELSVPMCEGGEGEDQKDEKPAAE